MGVYISEIGTHSFRKGVSTYLGSQPGGPSPISVFLRAGWSLGRVQSRYIFENEGGDQFVGRAATGLPLTDIKFASLPPHFISEQILTTAQWEEILPGYSNFYPVQFRTALPYLLASLVYHRNYIRQNYATTHPYFLTRLWRSNLLEQLASQVHVGIGINSVTSMEATGIPPYIQLAQRMDGLEQSIVKQTTVICGKFDSLPAEVCTAVLANCEVNGAVPITHQQVVSLMQDLKMQL